MTEQLNLVAGVFEQRDEGVLGPLPLLLLRVDVVLHPRHGVSEQVDRGLLAGLSLALLFAHVLRQELESFPDLLQDASVALFPLDVRRFDRFPDLREVLFHALRDHVQLSVPGRGLFVQVCSELPELLIDEPQQPLLAF